MTWTPSKAARTRGLLAKATPGPWEIANCSQVWANDKLIAETSDWDSPAEWKANAKFIAESPVLLADALGEIERLVARVEELERTHAIAARITQINPDPADRISQLESELACPCGSPAEFNDRWCGNECDYRSRTPLANLRSDNESLRMENARLREGLGAIANDHHSVYPTEGLCTMTGQYNIGVADGHRCAADKARAVLSDALLSTPSREGE